MALKKLCRCGKAIDPLINMCEECSIKNTKYRREYYKQYDRYRDADIATFYKSKVWEITRQKVIDMYHGIDIYDYLVNNKITYADTVHHIEELKDYWNRRLDINNLIPLSYSNHKIIHEMYKKKKKETQNLLFNLIKSFK